MRESRHPILKVILLIGLGVIALLLPVTIWAANLMQNDGLEPPFEKYGEWSTQGHIFDLEVAHAWERFFVPEYDDDGSKLRYFRASAVEFLYGYTEKRDGTDAQLFWSTAPFDGGIYQQVTGLTIDETYGFQAGIIQVYGNTTSKTHHKMFRSVGIDPYGGTDPTDPNVIWGPEEGLDVDWFYPGVGAQAKSITMTVFVRVRSIDDAPTFEENSVWVDDTFMDIAPVTSLDLTVESPAQVAASWSGTPRAGFHLFAYEAQYRKTTDSNWTDLQIFDSSTVSIPTATGASFTVEPGIEYIVRARTWHEQDGGDSHEVPGPWIEGSVTTGGFVFGNTLDNRGLNYPAVNVGVSGDPTKTTTSGDNGAYDLLTGAGKFGLVGIGNAGWTTSQPINVTVPDLLTAVPLTLTLQPPDNVIRNGDFEAGLNEWAASGSTPTTVSGGHYSGAASLSLTGTVSLSQTAFITDGYHPVLSFWYKMANGNGNLTAEILGTEALIAINSFSTSTVGDWQHAWLPLNLTEIYTGPVGVRFTLDGSSEAVVLLDGISLGSSREFNFVFLPAILK